MEKESCCSCCMMLPVPIVCGVCMRSYVLCGVFVVGMTPYVLCVLFIWYVSVWTTLRSADATHLSSYLPPESLRNFIVCNFIG